MNVVARNQPISPLIKGVIFVSVTTIITTVALIILGSALLYYYPSGIVHLIGMGSLAFATAIDIIYLSALFIGGCVACCLHCKAKKIEVNIEDSIPETSSKSDSGSTTETSSEEDEVSEDETSNSGLTPESEVSEEETSKDEEPEDAPFSDLSKKIIQEKKPEGNAYSQEEVTVSINNNIQENNTQLQTGCLVKEKIKLLSEESGIRIYNEVEIARLSYRCSLGEDVIFLYRNQNTYRGFFKNAHQKRNPLPIEGDTFEEVKEFLLRIEFSENTQIIFKKKDLIEITKNTPLEKQCNENGVKFSQKLYLIEEDYKKYDPEFIYKKVEEKKDKLVGDLYLIFIADKDATLIRGGNPIQIKENDKVSIFVNYNNEIWFSTREESTQGHCKIIIDVDDIPE